MYNNLKSHQFLSCIFVLVLATGCQSELKKARKEVEKLEEKAAAAHKKIQGYINQKGSRAAEEEEESISILDIPNPSNEIKTLYEKITNARRAAKTKDATLAIVSEQLKSLIFDTALLKAYAYAIEAFKACNEDSTVGNIEEITRQIKPAVEVKDQGPEGPALQQVEAALTQLEALVKQIKTKAREDVGTALKEAANAQGSSAIQEVKAAVIPIKVELDRIIPNQDADTPTAVKAAKKAKALLEVLQAILKAEKAVQGLTEKTVEEAEKAVQGLTEKTVEEAEKAVEVDASLAEEIEKAVTALQTQLKEAKKKLPKGDAQKSKAESSPAIPGGGQGEGHGASSAASAEKPKDAKNAGGLEDTSSQASPAASISQSIARQQKQQLQRLRQEQQRAVQGFRDSVITMFSNTQVTKLLNPSDPSKNTLDRLKALWNIVKVSVTLDDDSVIDSWIQDYVSTVLPPSRGVTQSIAIDFINSLNVTKVAINNVMIVLTTWKTDKSEQTDITFQQVTKVTEFFALAQGFSPPNSQSASTAQSTPNFSTP